MLNKKEIVIAHIASVISVFSMRNDAGILPRNLSMVDFILKTVPISIKPDVTMDLIDSVFATVSASRFDT